jgi:tetratricopeptide (TPR) repeat protein
MAFAPGTRLGPYEVSVQIGAGGMGEVYRATDTTLKRQVAIKVLPEAVAGDAERLARFQREAEVLASLNHPSIAAIYGLERADGRSALVMALVGLKRAIGQQPRHAGCLAMLAIVYADGYLLGYGTEENRAEQAVAYGRRAVAAEPSDHFTHYGLAFAHMSRKDVAAFHSAAERALALNPLDGGAMAGIAMFTAFLGEWQRGCELMQRAMTLNPRHPGWYWFPFVTDAYRRKEYSRALDYALRLNLPGFFHTHIWFAAVHGQLGNRTEAAQALRELDALYPDFGSHARHELDKWLAESALVEHWLEGLRKARLGC